MSSKEIHKTAPGDKISFGQKFAYGLGSIVNNLLGGAIGYMSIVLNVGLGINPALVGTLQAIPRLTDAMTDPIMGYISDNTRSKYGRRRPYIFIGAIFVGLTFALMWQLPAGYSEMFYFWFFLIGSIIFYLFYTIFATPWVALGYELTSDYHERTRLMGVMNFMGQFAWITLPWFYAFMENDRFFSDSVQGARTLAIIIGVFVAVVGIMPAIFCRERFVSQEGEVKAKNSFLEGLKKNIVEFSKGLMITIKRLEFFEKDPIPWNGENKLESFYQKLFDLKSKNPALRGGDPNATTKILQTNAPDKVLAYLRKNGNDEVLVVLNLSKQPILRM